MSARLVNMTLPARNFAESSGIVPTTYCSDIELMRNVADGKIGALEQLLEDHQVDVRRMVGRLTAWSSDVDDLTQEVFLKAWRAAKSFDGRGSLRNWLLTIAVRQCRNHHRAATRWMNALARFAQFKRDQPNSPSLYPTTSSSEEASSLTESQANQPENNDPRWQSMSEALSKLPCRDRELLVLIIMEQKAPVEVASLLNITTHNLYVRLHRAKARLTKQLETLNLAPHPIDP